MLDVIMLILLLYVQTVTSYSLDVSGWDPRWYGLALQSQVPIIGTDEEVGEELPPDVSLYRYQLFGQYQHTS